ncbi:MAG: hypothetical protein ABSG95_03055 [Solirubrobacteraceae bacterium]
MSPARAHRGLLAAGVLSLLSLFAGPVAVAAAELHGAPTILITSPRNGSATNDPTPVFTGTTNDILFEESLGVFHFDPVTLSIYKGAEVNVAHLVESLKTPEFLGEAWTIDWPSTLTSGLYTAQAVQENTQGGSERAMGSSEVTFTVDTIPPHLGISSPANGSSAAGETQVVRGSAGTEPGDLSAVMVQLFAGSGVGSGAPLETLVVQASEGSWSGTFGGLSPGTYTARAEQSDWAGNTGYSAPVSFTLSAPPAGTPPSPPAQSPAPGAPVASFQWFPASPQAGESVSLVSNSTDVTSALTGFAWALTPTGSFQAGKPVLTTSFATAGSHVVRLQVTNAAGLSSVVAKTIVVSPLEAALMDPFPIVRVAGSETSAGARISLLAVQAPVGTTVSVTCRGRGCPAKSEARAALSKRKGGTALITFKRFERSLRAGVVLVIRVAKRGEIGKYTRFAIRRGRLPERLDTCLAPGGVNPVACPS